jgi:hypothetical protein
MDTRPAKVPTLGRDTQSNIGRQLRSLYSGVLSEPVPDRLHALLQQLDRKSVDRS